VKKYKSLYPNIDLVTLDITMPILDGVTALEMILEFDKQAKVIMVSALGKEDMVKKYLIMGANKYEISLINSDNSNIVSLESTFDEYESIKKTLGGMIEQSNVSKEDIEKMLIVYQHNIMKTGES
jgi:response regulator of citrate/malate metabolism